MTPTTNSLHDQVTSLPELVRTQTWILEDRLRKLVPTTVVMGIRSIVLTGSGDSAIAGQAALQTFRALVKVPVTAATSLDASRFLAPTYGHESPYSPFVLATSNSGEVARVVEAARRTRQVGGYVVGLTGVQESRLAATSDVVLDIAAPSFAPSPGMRTYVMATLALNLFAIRFAEVRGRITMDQAQDLRHELASLGDAIEQAIAGADDATRTLAQSWTSLQGIEFLGAGPSLASGAFGSAKILEAIGKQSSAIDIEEFVHLNYFERASHQIGAVLICSAPDAAASRAIEIAKLLNDLERPWVALGDLPGAPVSVEPGPVRELFRPVVDAALTGLLAAHLMDATGEEPGRGATGRWSACADGATTRNSAIVDLPQTDAAATTNSKDAR